MPGWFIHLDVAREVAEQLGGDGEGEGFNQELADIIARFPNYYALGAIGPDLFFFLPDFKGGVGNFIARLAEWALDLWDKLDKSVIIPWESILGPISVDNNELVSRLTGGLSDQIAQISNMMSGIMTDAVLDFASRLGDWFSLLGAGPGPQYDDKLFYWSDMFHYRRTNEFAFDLFQRALANGYDDDLGRVDPPAESNFGFESGIAYALGWMTHIGTDVTGHCFVNEKAGGPYRLHWQRHHLVENHMDAFNYDFRHGKDPFYNLLATSAMHFWVQFRDDENHTPQYNWLAGVSSAPPPDPPPGDDDPTGPLPQYLTGLTSREYFKRNAIFDVDSSLPQSLAFFLLDTMKDTFYDRHTPENNDGMATHPMILKAVASSEDGRPDIRLLLANYDLFFSYLKRSTTDYWSIPKPQPPELFPNLSPPMAPGDDSPPDASNSTFTKSWEMLLAIVAWIFYVIDWIAYIVTILPALILDLATFPARYVLYLFEEAIYEIWKAFHLLLVLEGFVLPEPDEIDMGLVQLGLSSQGTWQTLLALVDDIFGGHLGDITTPLEQPVNDPAYPRDTVMDDPSVIQQFEGLVKAAKDAVLPGNCPDLDDPIEKPQPSEYLRPWQYPLENNNGDAVGSEPGHTRASPYVAGSLPTVLFGTGSGTDQARLAYEQALNPDATDALNDNQLSADFNLGDPTSYSLYVIGQLTAEDVTADFIPSFNLDADRGYGYKCWDWNRHSGYKPTDPPPTVTAHYHGDPSFDYPVACTPSRQFEKSDICGTGTPRDIPLDYDPGRKVQVHYLKLLTAQDIASGGYVKCGLDGELVPPIVPLASSEVAPAKTAPAKPDASKAKHTKPKK